MVTYSDPVEAFRRLFGREPTEEERTAFEAALRLVQDKNEVGNPDKKEWLARPYIPSPYDPPPIGRAVGRSDNTRCRYYRQDGLCTLERGQLVACFGVCREFSEL